MLTADMHVELPATGTLEDLLEAWAAPERAVDGVCLVCAGETLRVELRGGAQQRDDVVHVRRFGVPAGDAAQAQRGASG